MTNRKITDGDMTAIKRSISALLKNKKDVDDVLEDLHGVPMNINKMGEVCYKMREISNDIEFCVTKMGEIIEKDSK